MQEVRASCSCVFEMLFLSIVVILIGSYDLVFSSYYTANISSSIFNDYDRRMIFWSNEFTESGRRTIHGRCLIKHVASMGDITNHLISSFYDPNHAQTLAVMRQFPTIEEYVNYRNKGPQCISAGNPGILKGLNSSELISWANETEERWMIPVDHPGQQRQMCMNLSRTLGLGYKRTDYYDSYKDINSASYLIAGRRGLIDDSGVVIFNCGHYRSKDTNDYGIDEQRCRYIYNEVQGLTWEEMLRNIQIPSNIDLITNCTRKSTPVKSYKRVFTIAADFDNNFHHLVADTLARLPRYLSFLYENPDILIHVKKSVPSDTNFNWEIPFAEKTMRLMFLLLNINMSRVIYGSVIADVVFIPRHLHYAMALENPAEIRLLPPIMIKNAHIQAEVYKNRPKNTSQLPIHTIDNPKHKMSKKNLIILSRDYEYSTWGARSWTTKTVKKVLKAFQVVFQSHNVIIQYSKSLMEPHFCLACEILELTNADILVGMHGAGLTKAMFMPPGGIVMELSNHFGDVQMPLCGYYGNWAYLFGHHHYLYVYPSHTGHPENFDIDPFDMALKLNKFYRYTTSRSNMTTDSKSMNQSIRKHKFKQQRQNHLLKVTSTS